MGDGDSVYTFHIASHLRVHRIQVMSANLEDVTYVWGDSAEDDEVVFVTHQTSPQASDLIECHLIRWPGEPTAADEFVRIMETAVAGKYPGAIGVYESALYYGSVSVDSATGADTVKAAAKKMKALAGELRRTVLVICEAEIQVLDHVSKDVIKVFDIRDVSFTSLDKKDTKRLSFITVDAELGIKYCHAFGILDGRAKDIPLTIGEAFARYTEKLKSATEEELKALKRPRKGTSGAIGVFDAKYIGTVKANDIRGNETVETALEHARKQASAVAEPVVVIVTEDGIRTIEALTGVAKQSVFIEHITFTANLGDKGEYLGFISQDTRLQRTLCHLYELQVGIAGKVTFAIGDAFKKLKEKSNERDKNPFAAIFTEREPVPGQLFRCQVHRADVLPVKVIGAGQFGQVYLATYKKETQVAVKTVRLAASEDDKADFVAEAEVMRRLIHENLCKMVGVALQQRPWLCVIEFVKYGDLCDVLGACKDRKTWLSEWEQLNVVVQVCSGLEYIASKRFIHMDVAARNCLVGEGSKVKVADFGLTRRLDRGRDTYILQKTAKLPVRWLAIEAIETGIFSELTDVWAFGVLIWEVLCYGELPFKDVPNERLTRHVCSGPVAKPRHSRAYVLCKCANYCTQLCD